MLRRSTAPQSWAALQTLRPSARTLLAAAGLALAVLLTACAELRQAPPAAAVTVAPDRPFSVDGRLSARRGSDAVAANFAWRHDPPRDELSITTPLGQELADLQGDARLGRVELRMSDGRAAEAPDWPTMTERALGYRLPVDALAFWLNGGPDAADGATMERDAQGRPAVLREQGWEVVYGYADETAPRPSRLRISYPDLEVRIAIERWDVPGAARP